jgi:hypothetical protein
MGHDSTNNEVLSLFHAKQLGSPPTPSDHCGEGVLTCPYSNEDTPTYFRNTTLDGPI